MDLLPWITGTVIGASGLWLAIKKYRIDQEHRRLDAEKEPAWSLTKMGEKTWLLERTKSEPATIVGYEIGPDVCATGHISWQTPAGFPSMKFAWGDNIKFTLETEETNIKLYLYYKEYPKGTTLHQNGVEYQEQIFHPVADGIKSWSKQLL